MKKSSVYTRTGDSGTTSLVGGTRVPKNSPRLEAYGTIDEANSWLGLLDASDAIPEAAHATLRQAMNHMFDIGSALATEETSSWQPAPFPQQAIADLEADIDTLDSALPPQPIHIARWTCRRSTRQHSAQSSDVPSDVYSHSPKPLPSTRPCSATSTA